LDHSQRYRFRALIPEPVPYPPSTTSSGIGAAINVLTKLGFTIDWTILKENYYSPHNTSLRLWFEQIIRNLRDQIKKEWISDMERLQVNFPFFIWFPTFASKNGIQNVFTLPSLSVQTNLLKVWHFHNGFTVSSVHPPQVDIKIILKGEPTLATPFRKGRKGNDTVKLDDLKNVHQQANYIILSFIPLLIN